MKKNTVIFSVVCACVITVLLCISANSITYAYSNQETTQTGSIFDFNDIIDWGNHDYYSTRYNTNASTEYHYTMIEYETQLYTTEEPVGEVSTTEEPTTEEPTTEEPTTEESTTEESTTEEPTTEESTTEESTTEEPTTEEPTTREQTTRAPYTWELTTREQTTRERTTREPTTEEPTTEEPTTEEPTTEDDSYKEQSGDTDGDGEITAADARTVLRVCVKAGFISSEMYPYCEVDGDGVITASDARTVLRVAVKLEEKSALRKFVSDRYEYGWDFGSSRRTYPRYEDMCEGDSFTVAGVSARTTQKITWKSSNPQVASISADGKVTALKNGYSCVFAKVNNEYFYYDVRIKSKLQLKIESLKSKYPQGYYWNKHTPSKEYPAVSETPCDDHATGKPAYCKGQCAGFAYLLSGEIFGNAKATYGIKIEDIKIGDYVRLLPHHSVIIMDILHEGDPIGFNFYSETNDTARNDSYCVVHCNWYRQCDVRWEDWIPITDIDSNESFTRY